MPSRRQEGMTLVELLVSISILGIIGFALTESIILGLRTTEGTGARIASANAAQALDSYFVPDAESADRVFADEGSPGGACAPAGAAVFLHLRWTDVSVEIDSLGNSSAPGNPRSVSYALDPATGPEQDLVRWTCTNAASPGASKVIGHFSQISDGGIPVTVECDPVDATPAPEFCPAFDPLTTPVPTQIRISTDPATTSDDVTVRRRSA